MKREAFVETKRGNRFGFELRQCAQPNLSEILQTLAPTVQTSAVGLNYHIVVPCVNGALFYFLVHCLCLYFHVNILFSSSKYSRSHPGPACWKSAPQQANQMVSKSSDFLCCFMSALQHSCHNSKVFFFPSFDTHLLGFLSWCRFPCAACTL